MLSHESAVGVLGGYVLTSAGHVNPLSVLTLELYRLKKHDPHVVCDVRAMPRL